MSRILIAEDTRAFREPLALILRDRGHETVCVEDGEQALASISQGIPDLILLDAGMPKMDGFTFLSRIRQNPVWKDVPVIILTATAERDYEARARAIGISDYLVKSQFSLEQFLTCIQKYLPVKGRQ